MWSIQRTIPGACALTALLGFIATPARPQITLKPVAGDPVKIASGLVSGTYLPTGVKAYLGLPFAEPPVRELRWRAPQPVKAWSGVFTANRMQPECPQNLRSSDINHYFGEEALSEDCLYLNVWAPASARTGAKLPVVVWIYGGGFTGGSAGMAVYGGEPLARKGVVYVNFNYRIGILGFLAHPDATKESGENASGDWGLLDQVAALQWVHRNIAQFGGDPSNVMIIGQSAGSMSICDLQASPLVKGLIAKAFGQSGATVTSDQMGATLAAAEASGTKLQEALHAKSLSEMRAASWDKVVNAARTANVSASPIADGYFLPKSPKAIFSSGQQNDVPIVVGWTANDIGTNSPIRNAKTLDEYKAAANAAYGAKASEFLALFPAVNDGEARNQAERVGRLSGFGVDARAWARAQALQGKAPAYLYLFSRAHTYPSGVTISGFNPATAGAYHMADTPFWLDTIDSFNMFRTTRAWTAADKDMAAKMSEIVVAFARTGVPTAPGAAIVQYRPQDEQMTEFGDTIQVVKLDTKALDFLAANPAAAGGRGRGGAAPADGRGGDR
jgi:para-nitrobenzyl esterase